MHADETLRPTIELAAGDLRLRPWRDADAARLAVAVHESVASVGHWLPWCHADYTEQDAATWIAHCQAGWAIRRPLRIRVGGGGLG